MKRVGLRDLEAVLAIARRGSFRAAALDLDMSNTALSHAIAGLENDLGVRLFNRTTRSVVPTEAGREFVDRVGPALSDIGGALEAARSHGETPSGLLRINSSAIAAQEFLADLLAEFLRRYPQMRVDVTTEEQLVDIVAEGYDLGLRARDLVPTDMIALSLGRSQRFAVVASLGYLAGHAEPRKPADLTSHECIRVRLPNGALYRWPFERRGESVLIDVPGRLTLDEAGIAKRAVLRGMGIGLLHEESVRDDVEAGHLVQLLEDWIPPRPDMCLYYPGRRHPSAGLAAFLVLAREFAADTRIGRDDG